MAGERWSTARLCNVVGTREVKNKCTTGCKREVTFQIAYWDRINLVHRINTDWGANEWQVPICRLQPSCHQLRPQVFAGEALRCQGLPGTGTWGLPGVRRRKAGRPRLEPSPANQLSIKHFWSGRNSPRGSRLTFTLGGKLIPGAHLVGCSSPQGNQYGNIMIMLRTSFYFRIKPKNKECAVSIDFLNLHIWIYMFDVCLLCAAVCQT